MPIKVVYQGLLVSFNTSWMTQQLAGILEFEKFDPAKTYPVGTLHYINCTGLTHPAALAHVRELADRGFKVIGDNLWEVLQDHNLPMHVITCAAWFWYNESQWYTKLGYNTYTPNKDLQYRALMPINKRRLHRDDFVNKINLAGLLWSYVDQGIRLPNDGDTTDWFTNRYLNPDWYDQTYASMVVETYVRSGSKSTPIFITEKTMKPMAFQHPFVVYGNRHTLATLHDWGFATFDNLWDESYDEQNDFVHRRNAVINIVDNIVPESYSKETQERLAHNRNRFFDTALVQKRIHTEIVEPILNYAETR